MPFNEHSDVVAFSESDSTISPSDGVDGDGGVISQTAHKANPMMIRLTIVCVYDSQPLIPDSGKALVRSPTSVLSPPSTINVSDFQGDGTVLRALIPGVSLIALNYCTSKLPVRALDDGIDRIRT